LPENSKKMSPSKNRNRISPLDPESATGKTKQLFDDIRARLGFVPNLFRVLGNAPSALQAYFDFSSALQAGTLDAKVQEQIGIAVAESNLCDYCLAAHVVLGRKAGLTEGEIADAIHAKAANTRTDAIMKLARGIIVERGEISDVELERARGRPD
jgi:AhpD family alkylhydroperoxidase